LSLFPEDYIARRKAEGISVTREPMPASEAELRRYACDFRIPGEVMPMFVIGKPLAALARGAVASVRLIEGKLAVLFDNQPAFQLERISSDTFCISGLPAGMTLRFKEDNNTVREVTLNMKGLPKDLYAARLGKFQGPSLDEREVSLPIVNPISAASGSH
jgi:hypothetical protein